VCDPDLKTAAIAAFPTSFPVQPDDSRYLGGGVVDCCESHHGRAHAL
jgi:hypothetical protein